MYSVFISTLSYFRVRKSNVSYKSVGQLPKEPELKELKLYVGK